MLELLNNYIAHIIIALAVLGLIILLLRRRKRKKGHLKLERDNSGLWRYHRESEFLRKNSYGKSFKEENKTQEKASEKAQPVAVISFNGDIRGKLHSQLAQLVDEVVINKEELAGVVVLLQSAGGMVSPYGHALSQLERIRAAGLDLTVCIDVIAASGGYLMSAPANKIVAAPFAIVGSVGVVSFVPNFRKFLLKHDVVPRTFTAGQYKRTVTLTDDATAEEIARFQQQLEAIHRQFIEVVKKYRANVNLEIVQTGAYWTAQESVSLELGLVDELASSEEYLLKLNKTVDLVQISQKRSFWDDKFGFLGASVEAWLRQIFSANKGQEVLH